MPSLYDVFLDGQRPEVTWQELWRTMAAHPQMAKLVNYAVAKLVKRVDGCVSRADVANDCYLELAANIRRDKSMSFDFARLEKFEAWLACITRNACVHAIRKYARQQRTYEDRLLPTTVMPDTDVIVVTDLIEYLAPDSQHEFIIRRITEGHSMDKAVIGSGLTSGQAWYRIKKLRPILEEVLA